MGIRSFKIPFKYVIGQFLLVFSFSNCSKTQFTSVEYASETPVTPQDTDLPPEVSSETTTTTTTLRMPTTTTTTTLRMPTTTTTTTSSTTTSSTMVTTTSTSTTTTSTSVTTTSTTTLPVTCRFNGESISTGRPFYAYKTSTVPFGQSCEKELRECLPDGRLSGSFSFASCEPGQPEMCLFENKTIPHDSSIDRFESASVPYDQQCKKEARVCRNGKVSGTYEYSHCQPETPLSCSFNGQEIKHNESIFVYTTDSVPFGSSCEGVKASLRCINGNMNSSAGSQKIFGTCQILPEVKPKDPCGEVVDEFIVRQVVTRHSGSYLPVMVTPLVQGESYCSDNLVEKIPENLKTVSYVEANTRFHICMYPALPKWYDDGRWVGANYFSSGGISFAITGPYKIVSKRDPKFLHGHESLNQFTRNRGLTFVQGKNENYNLNNLWVCLRPPPKPSSGGGGGRPDYNVNLQ